MISGSGGMNLNGNTGIRILYGIGMIAGIIALWLLTTGDWESFIGASAVCLGSFGLGGAKKRALSTKDGKGLFHGISFLIRAIFLFGGPFMLIAGVVMFFDGDVPVSSRLVVLGLVFCAAGFIGSRVFAKPKTLESVETVNRIEPADDEAAWDERGPSREGTEFTYTYDGGNTNLTISENVRESSEEKPWTRRKDWAEGKVVEESAQNLDMLVVITVVWNIVFWGIAGYNTWADYTSRSDPWYFWRDDPAYVILLIVGIALAIYTALAWIRKRKFGISILHCRTMPFRPGEKLQGTVQTGMSVENPYLKEFSVRLACVWRRKIRGKTWHQGRGFEKRIDEKKTFGVSNKWFLELFPKWARHFKFQWTSTSPPTCLLHYFLT
jgi:hypothetical protein